MEMLMTLDTIVFDRSDVQMTPDYSEHAAKQSAQLKVLLHRARHDGSQRGRKRQAGRLQDFLNTQEVVVPQAADVLIQAEHTALVAKNLPKFIDLDHQQLADRLVTNHEVGILATHLTNFRSLTEQTAWQLIKDDKGKAVQDSLSSFTQELTPELAMHLIENGGSRAVTDNFDRFPDFNQVQLVDALLAADRYDIVLQNIHKLDEVDHDEIAQRIVTLHRAAAGYVAQDIDRFNLKNMPSLIRQIVEAGVASHLEYHVTQFDSECQNMLLHTLIKEGNLLVAIAMLHRLENNGQLDPEIAIKLTMADNPGIAQQALQNISAFAAFDHNILVNNLLSQNNTIALLDEMYRFVGIDADAIVARLLATDPENTAYDIARSLGHLPLKDTVAVAKQLITLGYETFLSHTINQSAELRASANELLLHYLNDTASIRPGYNSFLASVVTYCKDLSTSVAQQLIDHGQGQVVMKFLGSFNPEYRSLAFDDLIKAGDVATILRHRKEFEGQRADAAPLLSLLENQRCSFDDIIRLTGFLDLYNISMAFRHTLSLFGSNATTVEYQSCVQLENGNITKKFAELGVTKSGKEGFEQLSALLDGLRHKFTNPSNQTMELLLQSQTARSIFKDFVRYDESQWGRRDDTSLKNIIATSIKNHELEELAPGYEMSDIINIPLKNQPLHEEETIGLSEDVLARYTRLRKILWDAIQLVKSYKLGEIPFEDQLSVIHETISGKLGRMAVARNNMLVAGKETQASFLQTQIETLQTLIDGGLYDTASLDKNILALHKESRSADELMTILTAKALRFDQQLNPDARRERFAYAEQLYEWVLSANPNDKSLAALIDLFGHVISSETYGQALESQQARQAVHELFNVQSLERALSERSNSATNSIKEARLQYIPSRGLLMELSGHIGDACWANRYPSIAAEFPNFTSVLMVRHFDKQPPRMVGSMMLIETTDPRTGEEYIVIRGLNPIENFINKVDVTSFFDSVNSYVSAIADRRGKRVGVVIEHMAGRSGTNRPALHAHMRSLQPILRSVRVPYESTTFNGYDITSCTYALS